MRLGILGNLLPLLGKAQTKTEKKTRNGEGVPRFESKEEYSTKNGGILLEKQIAISQGQDIGALQLKVYTKLEVKSATKNYDPDLIVCSDSETFIYKGTLDDRTVAIETPRDCGGPNRELTDRFLTDVAIGMLITNTNMVIIYGCCLETCIPMLVYQFYPNRDLHRYLHGDTALEKPLRWSRRLRAAVDTAYALSYMHNALSKPVVHRDVMSNGILLDFSFHAKLGNLGYSVSITPGKKDQRWPVRGTSGYIDPEYIETQEVSEKCDVYSFGVLMLELLTTRDPIEMARYGKDLVDEFFVSEGERNGVNEMIDKNVLEEGNLDEINRFVRLALACVAKKGEDRPGMISVVEELWQIQDEDSKRVDKDTK